MAKRFLTSQALMVAVLIAALVLPVFAGGQSEARPAAPAASGAAQPAAPAAQPAPAPAPARTAFLTFGGGPQGGMFGTAASALSSVLTERMAGRINLTVEGSGGGGENIVRVNSGEFELGITDGMNMYEAYKGMNAHAGAAKTNLRAVGLMINGVLQLVTMADSGINSLRDLQGRVVAVGTPGSSTEEIVNTVLATLNITVRPQFILGGAAATALRDGQVEAMFWAAPIPVGAIAELAVSRPIRLIDVATPLKASNYMEKHFYNWFDTIPVGTYGSTAAMPSLNTGLYWITNKDVSADLIYEMCKVAYENTEALRAAYGPLRAMNLREALNGVEIPLHPGAIRFFEERGVQIPAKLR